jgi:hypothetical protein
LLSWNTNNGVGISPVLDEFNLSVLSEAGWAASQSTPEAGAEAANQVEWSAEKSSSCASDGTSETATELRAEALAVAWRRWSLSVCWTLRESDRKGQDGEESEGLHDE